MVCWWVSSTAISRLQYLALMEPHVVYSFVCACVWEYNRSKWWFHKTLNHIQKLEYTYLTNFIIDLVWIVDGLFVFWVSYMHSKKKKKKKRTIFLYITHHEAIVLLKNTSRPSKHKFESKKPYLFFHFKSSWNVNVGTCCKSQK